MVWDCKWDNFIQKQIVMALGLCPKCIFGQYLKNEWTNFNKILHMHCTDIGIGEEWYGIASGTISFRNK